mgnify:CR=1 FL=1
MNLLDYIRPIPDYPKPGVTFQDITPLLLNPQAFSICIQQLVERVKPLNFDKIGIIDARGFIFGAALAYALQKPFFPLRKANKLPFTTLKTTYQLEYGNDSLEMHSDAVAANDKILIIDDILATGGTVSAACDLVQQAGATVSAIVVILEITALNAAKKINPNRLISLFKI